MRRTGSVHLCARVGKLFLRYLKLDSRNCTVFKLESFLCRYLFNLVVGTGAFAANIHKWLVDQVCCCILVCRTALSKSLESQLAPSLESAQSEL